MTGLEKITSGIIDDAKSEANAIIEKAQENANEIIASAENECSEELTQAQARIDAEYNRELKKIDDAAAARVRLDVLTEKQRIIDSMLGVAFDELCNIDDEKYKNIITDLFSKRIRKGNAKMYFSKSDIDKLGTDFFEGLKDIATKNESTLNISERNDIKKGFMLIMGGIEENCTFEAMFGASKSILSDKTAQILFAEQ